MARLASRWRMGVGMTRILAMATLALGAALAIQTWRLDRAQDKADRLDTCKEVQSIKEEVRNATDDDAARRISEPR